NNLTSIEETLPHLKNIHVKAEEHDGKVVFLHQINDGPADESYGIQVAKLANLPDTLIERASTILYQLEGENQVQPTTEKMESGQLSFFVEEPPKQGSLKDHQPMTAE